jgi:FkbH-like protein
LLAKEVLFVSELPKQTVPLMKLIDALEIIRQSNQSNKEPFELSLVCGFTPLHLQSFLQAEMQQRLPDLSVRIIPGTYNDIAGTLKILQKQRVDATALVLEWADLDARLGTRQLGGWGPGNLATIIDQVNLLLLHLQQLLGELAALIPIAISLPTLPLPPLFFTAGWQSSHTELRIKELLSSFAAAISVNKRIRVLSRQTLDRVSPPAERLNLKSDWMTGFPYHNTHASSLASLLAQLLINPLPKKGLITDLDNTLWRGIVGDIGPQAISWDLDHHSQAHGLYQQFLRTLTEEGVLVALASKNDPATVEEAFSRTDMVLPKSKIFPIEVSWGSKAKAVSRILSVWNIAADSVVFVDDSPAELAEVKAQHPEIENLLFPREDPAGVYELLLHLRDVFGRSAVSDEDRIRHESIRARASLLGGAEESDGFSEVLLAQAEAELTISFRKDLQDARALELVNKTNQFNLNGKRFTESGWRTLLQQENAFMLTASYTDRFGALGKIAVLAGRTDGSQVHVEAWVMSCRAFARRIEYQCLQRLFDRFNIEQIAFDYGETLRNKPLTNFFTELLEEPPIGSCAIDRKTFAAACPKLYHHIKEIGDE